MGEATKYIHPGNEVEGATGAVSTPIYQSVIFAQKDLNHEGEWQYTREGNPTRDALEKEIAALEGGKYGFAFSSGMAAIAAAFCIFSAGDHILVAQDIYGGTYGLVEKLLPRFGFRLDLIDATDISAITRAIQPQTKALFLETPSNPLMKITDLPAVAGLAREHGITTIIDNTMMTPFLQSPLKLGIDIVVHSATKYLGGHSDCLAGLVVTKDRSLAKEIKFLQLCLGAVLGPQDCWLILRGLKTLPVRMEKQQTTARRMAEWLSECPQVVKVYYPGLSDPEFTVHHSQARGSGGVLSFRLRSPEEAGRLINNVRLPVIGSSLGAVESIISLPAAMSHAAVPGQMRETLGLTDDLVRLSVGLEDFEDLQADLAQAFAKL